MSSFGFRAQWVSINGGWPYLCFSAPPSLWYCMHVTLMYEHKRYQINLHNNVNQNITFVTFVLWVGQMMAMGLSVWNKKNIILARDSSMFISPHYNGVLLEQQILLNRKVNNCDITTIAERVKKTIFVCSTMYHESGEEMKQLLSSVYKLACHYSAEKEKDQEAQSCDHFESHIFFDDGVNGDSLTQFALQLVSLLEQSLKVDIKGCQKFKTPYGYRLSWLVNNVMPFSIHLKDNTKIKNKKRWSQVMYMKYVLCHCIQNLCNSTFILMTDGDVCFEPKSALILLDMLDSDPQIGAVCARTHPQGSGLLYWYQVFDYAIGHWFQKAAEHILGCVLCCPGCFSAFRCPALESVLDEYSTDVISAREFLTKEMGEDRWLCTLLVEKGWRLEYCAVSKNHTHCPEDFDTFYKQRRRWIPSTVANLLFLITQTSKITQGNDAVSILFVLFQGILVFSTAVSPATVILVIASGFSFVSEGCVIAIIVILLSLSVTYGLFCIYGSPQQQLNIARFASLILVIFMGIVFIGNLKNLIYDIVYFSNNCNHCLNTTNGTFVFPLTPTTMYLLLFTLLFFFAALLHMNEFSCLIHGVWYFLALPSGYLILLIYSVANLDDRSWGTREASSGGQREWASYFKNALHLCLNTVARRWTREVNDAEENDPPSDPPTQHGKLSGESSMSNTTCICCPVIHC